MKNILSLLNANPIKMIKWAWLIFIFNLLFTFVLLPYAKFWYLNGYAVLGYILHRSCITLFLLSAILGILGFIASIVANISNKNQSMIQCITTIGKRAILTIPVILVNGLAVLLLFVGKYLGLTLY